MYKESASRTDRIAGRFVACRVIQSLKIRPVRFADMQSKAKRQLRMTIWNKSKNMALLSKEKDQLAAGNIKRNNCSFS